MTRQVIKGEKKIQMKRKKEKENMRKGEREKKKERRKRTEGRFKAGSGWRTKEVDGGGIGSGKVREE